jgi:hypothetical protein
VLVVFCDLDPKENGYLHPFGRVLEFYQENLLGAAQTIIMKPPKYPEWSSENNGMDG